MLSTRAIQSTVRASARQVRATTPAVGGGLRAYATAADSVKPPVPLFGIDGTYANALYTAAAKSSALDPTARALDALANTFRADPKLPTLLSAPTLTAADKSAIVAELSKVTGATTGEGQIVSNFLSTLAANNRLGVLAGVCDKFATLMGAHRGELDLVVTSAQELDRRSLNRIESAVSKSEYSLGRKLKVVPKVNPDLVGGLVVEVGDRTIDLSVSTKIAKLNKALTDML